MSERTPEMNEEMAEHFSVTYAHINKVREKIWVLIQELDARAKAHDHTKLESPQKEIFAKENSKLASLTYGTPEYEESLQRIQPALDDHYAKERHHPAHWEHGVDGMDLIDVIEMVCDWVSSTERNRAGNIHKIMAINKERFQISDQLAKIITNTVERHF